MGKLRAKLFYSLWIAIVILISLVWHDAYAQIVTDQYFPETGHWVTGEFLDLYRSADNPEELYGYPITDAFEDPRTYRFVQYFERTRFELHPEEPLKLPVQRAPLGAYLYKPGRPLPVPKNSPSCQTFSETGYQVCYAFLDFFNENGKVPQFGYPISNFEIHDGRIVQYFQLARLEWHPNEPHQKRVKVSNLGQIYFNKIQEDPRRTLPRRQSNIYQVVSQIKVIAFPEFAVVSHKDKQSINIIVHDQNYLPIKNAKITLEILLPSGDIIRNQEPLSTNEDGIASYPFKVLSVPKGDAIVKIVTSFGDYDEQTSTSFRIWW